MNKSTRKNQKKIQSPRAVMHPHPSPLPQGGGSDRSSAISGSVFSEWVGANNTKTNKVETIVRIIADAGRRTQKVR